jgi:hypothetical protein
MDERLRFVARLLEGEKMALQKLVAHLQNGERPVHPTLHPPARAIGDSGPGQPGTTGSTR